MIAPTWHPDQKQLRQFAVISLLGFGLVGSIVRFRFGWETASVVLGAVGALTCLIGLASPRAIFPVYTTLMLIAELHTLGGIFKRF